jgi:hypothetical protein
MGLSGILSAVEPTRLLQTILETEIKVRQSKERYVVVQRCYEGGLLTAATITGVGACASETLTLIPDIICKAARGSIRVTQYVINPAFLDKLYPMVPERESFSFRIERILAQALGVIVSALGTLFVLVLHDGWAVQLHRSLGNYKRPLPVVPSMNPRKEADQPVVPKQPETASTGQTNAGSPPPPLLQPSASSPPLLSAPPSRARAGSSSPSRPPLPVWATTTPPQPPSDLIQAMNDPTSSPETVQNVEAASQPSPPPLETASKTAPKTLQDEIILGTKLRKVEKQERPKIYLNTISRAVSKAIDGKYRANYGSERVNLNAVQKLYTIKADKISVREMEEELNVGFEIDEEDLDQTFSAFIIANYGQSVPPVDTIVEFQGYKVKITKLNSKGTAIEKVTVKDESASA